MDSVDAKRTRAEGAIYTDGGYMKDSTGANVGSRWWNECNVNIMPSHYRSDFGDYVRPYSRSCNTLFPISAPVIGNSSDKLALFLDPDGNPQHTGAMGNNVGGAQTAFVGSGYANGVHHYSSNMIADLSDFLSFESIFAIKY